MYNNKCKEEIQEVTKIARPKKYRKICHFPKTLTFVPVGNRNEKQTITLTIDEYETLRLIDKEGRSQEECSASMKVARTTVQMIYASARKKVAEAIVDGRSLEIEEEITIYVMENRVIVQEVTAIKKFCMNNTKRYRGL